MSAPKFSALFSANQAQGPCPVKGAVLPAQVQLHLAILILLPAAGITWREINFTWREYDGGNMTAGINWRCLFLAGSFPGGIFFLPVKWNLPVPFCAPMFHFVHCTIVSGGQPLKSISSTIEIS